MYVPLHFSEPRLEVLHDLIQRNPLGALITNGRSGLDANHIPFELEKTQGRCGTLHCHVARANPVWQDVSNGEEVLAVFRPAHAYISPGWYPSKRETGRQVPTWNYLVAHAHGRVTIRDDERYVRTVVAKLTKTHEAGRSAPWKMSDSPRDYIAELLKSIVGIEIEITRLVGKSKLNQDDEAADIRGAALGLKEGGESVVSPAMLQVAIDREAKR